MSRPDYVERPDEETPAQSLFTAILGLALLALMFICVSLVIEQAKESKAAAIHASAGPVCPDYGTEYHSCE